MKKITFTNAFFVLVFSFNSYAMDGREIMKDVIQASYYQGQDVRANAHMTIIDQQGRERIRALTLLRRNMEDSGNQKYYVYFNKPSDVKKMVFMAWKNSKKEDDRWLYLPALDLVKRIAASDDRTSFVGSHFYYEDVSGRGLDEDNHQLVSEDEIQYVIKSQPKIAEAVEFSHYKIWVDKETYLPTKIEYYDKNNVVYRIYRLLDTKNIDGNPTVIKAQMEDLRSGGKTITKYSAIVYSQNIPEKIFSERYLRKSPKKYLK